MSLFLRDEPGYKVYGPYLNAGQGRRQVVISRNGKLTTKSYARWLMEEKLGRQLHPDEETVDHEDENPLNDNPANFQLLTRQDNARKSHVEPEMATFPCPVCGIVVTKLARHVRHNRNQGKAGPFCGKKCARAWQLRKAS